MIKYSAIKKVIIKKKGLDFETFEKMLSVLCDENFNGDSGEQYVEDKDKNRFSLLHYYLKKEMNGRKFDEIASSDLIDIARTILSQSNSTEPYYDYSVFGYETLEDIIIQVLYKEIY